MKVNFINSIDNLVIVENFHPERDRKIKSGDKIDSFIATGKYITVLESGKKKVYFEVVCECGNIGWLSRNTIYNRGRKHCGCKLPRKRERTSEYIAWSGARDRCNRPSAPAYDRYGGRGIKVCKEWDDYEVFLRDMGYKPSPEYSLDRIDVDGDYCKGNCRWATIEEQANNKRNNVLVDFNGEKYTLTSLAKKLNLPRTTVRNWHHLNIMEKKLAEY